MSLPPAAGVPAARVLAVPDVVALPQLAERDFVTELPFPGRDDRILRVVGNGIQVDGEAVRASASPPLLGEHTQEILTGLGYSDADILDLRAAGVL